MKENDLKYKRTPLHEAAEQGKLEAVKQLLAQGADVNARDDFQNTPLHIAIFSIRNNKPFDKKFQNDKLEIIKILIKHKADLNVENIVHVMPIQAAFGATLIKMKPKGFNPSIEDYEYVQKTLIFSKLQDLKILKLLIDNGANVDISHQNYHSARHFINTLMQNEYGNDWKNNHPEAHELINDLFQSINKDNYYDEQKLSITGNLTVVYDEVAM